MCVCVQFLHVSTGYECLLSVHAYHIAHLHFAYCGVIHRLVPQCLQNRNLDHSVAACQSLWVERAEHRVSGSGAVRWLKWPLKAVNRMLSWVIFYYQVQLISPSLGSMWAQEQRELQYISDISAHPLIYCCLGIRKSIRPIKIEWWGVGVVICLERGADCSHMVQLMPLHPKTSSTHASFKSRLVSPFWYWLTQAVLENSHWTGVVEVVLVITQFPISIPELYYWIPVNNKTSGWLQYGMRHAH